MVATTVHVRYLKVVDHHERFAQVMGKHGTSHKPNLQAKQQPRAACHAHHVDVLLGTPTAGSVHVAGEFEPRTRGCAIIYLRSSAVVSTAGKLSACDLAARLGTIPATQWPVCQACARACTPCCSGCVGNRHLHEPRCGAWTSHCDDTTSASTVASPVSASSITATAVSSQLHSHSAVGAWVGPTYGSAHVLTMPAHKHNPLLGANTASPLHT